MPPRLPKLDNAYHVPYLRRPHWKRKADRTAFIRK